MQLACKARITCLFTYNTQLNRFRSSISAAMQRRQYSPRAQMLSPLTEVSLHLDAFNPMRTWSSDTLCSYFKLLHLCRETQPHLYRAGYILVVRKSLRTRDIQSVAGCFSCPFYGFQQIWQHVCFLSLKQRLYIRRPCMHTHLCSPS